MMRLRLHILIFVVVAVIALCGGCEKSYVPQTGNQIGGISFGKMFIRLSISIPGEVSPNQSAASISISASNLTTPGTSPENAVRTIDLLVYDVEKDSLINIISLNDRIEQLQSPNGAIIAFSAVNNSRVRICAAANLPAWIHSRLFVGQSSKVSIASDETDFQKVMDAFVPGSKGKEENLAKTDYGAIPMTGVFKNMAGRDTFTVSENTMQEDKPLVLKADMVRLVSKLHVLAKPSDNEMQSGYADCEIGWIKLDDIRYTVNGINKSTYLFQQFAEYAAWSFWEDCNMDLTAYTASDSDKFDESLWSRDFVFYKGLQLHKENISKDSFFATAELYDDARIEKTIGGKNDPQRYVRGMYCLENFFGSPPSGEDPCLALDEAIPMVTHVSVAARLVPDRIVLPVDFRDKMDRFVAEYRSDKVKFRQTYGLGEDDFDDAQAAHWENLKTAYFNGNQANVFGDFFLYPADKEEDARDVLTWSLMYNKIYSSSPEDFEKGKYFDGTFYCYDTGYGREFLPSELQSEKFLYLSVGAVAAAFGQYEAFATYSVQHLGGWGYYYAYPDETGGTQGGVVSYRRAQVTRNKYYLLTVNRILSPGGTITKPEYIKLNTIPADWDYVAKGNVQLQ